ncbi:MAG: hypothetical protein QME42_03985 [bacterium]|nr:hypothetical protein [bacterium]
MKKGFLSPENPSLPQNFLTAYNLRQVTFYEDCMQLKSFGKEGSLREEKPFSKGFSSLNSYPFKKLGEFLE